MINENMPKYNLFEKEKTENIVANKVICIILFCITIILFITAFVFNPVIFYFASMSIILSFILLISYLLCRKQFGRKISISFDNKKLFVYSYSNKKIKEIILNEMLYSFVNIVFYEYRRRAVCYNCLVFHKNIELYNEMEYRSYWNDPNLLIIQNPILIKKLSETFHLENQIPSAKTS